MAASGQGLVGLMVAPTNQSVCKVMFWSPQTVLSSPQSGVVETAPAAAVLPSANPLGSIAVLTVRLWLQWQGGTYATQYLEQTFSLGLPGSPWSNFLTVIPPTPTIGNVTNLTGTNRAMFYRVRVTR